MKKQRREEGANTGTFTVLMTSLSIIMLAFFILLNSLATLDTNRVKKALGSLTGAFGLLPGGFKTGKGDAIIPAWMVELGIKDSVQSLEDFLEKKGKGKELHIEQGEEGLVLNLSSKLFFPSGSAEIRPEGLEVLDKVAEIIKAADVPARIEGHTDDVPIRTIRYRSNWELSAHRASMVLRYFIEKAGIAPERLSAVGYSQYRPLVPNDTAENRAKNRRVAFVLLNYGVAGGNR